MKWSLEEIAESCERALADQKSGSKERSILNLATRNVKKALKDTRCVKDSPKRTNVTTTSSGAVTGVQLPCADQQTPEMIRPSSEQCVVSPPEQLRERMETDTPRDFPSTRGETQPNVPPPSSSRSNDVGGSTSELTTSLDQFATSCDDLNCLAYAAAISMVGESGSHYGSIVRGSSKALASSLELVVSLLNSPLIPTNFACQLPSFEFSKKDAHSGAQIFFSKLLGGGSQGAAKLSTRNQTEAADAGPRQQARLLLVDAVLAASDVIRSRDTADKLWFVYLAALSAAAVPQQSRAHVPDTSDALVRTDYLCLHDERLVKIFEFLFGTLSMPDATPVLIEVTKTVMQRVAKALSNYVEQRNALTDNRKGEIARPGRLPSPAVELSPAQTGAHGESDSSHPIALFHGSSHSGVPSLVTKGIEDMQRVLRVCTSIVTSTPVAHTSTGAGAGGLGNSTSGASGGSGGAQTAVAPTADGSESSSAIGGPASQSSIAVTTALGTLLSFIVNGGPAFRNSGAIAQVIRQSVLPATMRLSLSPDVDIFRLSLNVILYSCFRFSESLVSETGTVFRHVYFRVLSSKFAALTQKLLVLDVFQKYIEEPQNLIGLFLNYDCNTYSQSVYEEMIQYLAALAFPWPMRQASTSANPIIKELYSSLAVKLEYDVDGALRQRAMEQLVMVADSNIQWIERFEDDSAVVDAATGNAEAGEGQSAQVPSDSTLRVSHSAVTEDTPDAAMGIVASSQDTFLQARRYKDAFKKFLYMFNEKGSSEAAIEFLRSSVLFENLSPARQAADGTTTTAAVSLQQSGDVSHAGLDRATPSTADETANTVDSGSANALTASLPPPARTDASLPATSTAPSSPPTNLVVHNEDDAEGGVTAPSDGLERVSTPDVGNDSFGGAVEDAAVMDAHKVAVFLRRNEDYLDKLVLGDYFAKSFRKQTTRLVFEEWITLHNFSGMTLDEALRLFLGGFKLLGEAQVVDKTMELFAAQYCRQNPTVFRAADTAFILSFSICMLNTDAHSAHIKNKMSLEGFVKNNAGIDDGVNVNPDILTGIYHRITQEEIVLRPSPYCPSFRAKTHTAGDDSSAGGGQKKVAAGILRSVPILRSLIPLATAITDKVALPIDMFNSAERKREELYQAELTSALKDIMAVVQSSDATLPNGSNTVHLVTASRIEHAIPMWEVTVSSVCNLLIASLVRFCGDAETYTPMTYPSTSSAASTGTNSNGGPGGANGGGTSLSLGAGVDTSTASRGVGAVVVPPAPFGLGATSGSGGSGGADTLNSCTRASCFLREKPMQRQFLGVLLHGLDSVMKVCCAFGNVMHTEMVVEHCYELTQLSRTVVCSGQPKPHVVVTQSLSAPRLALVSTLLNLFVAHGTSLTSPSWQFCYSILSFLDASANGIDGMFRRKSRKLLQSSSAVAATKPKTPPPDMWFGDLLELPSSVSPSCAAHRLNLLNGLRQAPGSTVDLWLERLFDATRYPFVTQVHMANGLAPVAAKELQTERVFSLTKLFDFVSSCASLSSRLQWRELWSHARAVFVMAGRMNDVIANSTLDGLRIIALTYLMREELFNYSFQKEVLKPFEDILMSNQSVPVRMHIIRIVTELIEFRASSLASGWSVVFSCLSHAAVIPEIVASAWETCETIITTQLVQVKDYFSEFVFCLTTFACTNMEENVALKGISHLVACGHWLVYGLETPPADVRTAAEVVSWACRFGSADAEVQVAHNSARHLTRVTLAADLISSDTPLTKPISYTGKTAYQVWMSLFEGLVPVVVIQSSVRVRVHAIDCIWTLVKVFGCAFDADVQDALFSGMLRPMLTTVTNHVPSPVAPQTTVLAASTPSSSFGTVAANAGAPPSSQASHSREMDSMDYSILTGVTFHGMLSACLTHPHLLELACETLIHFCTTAQLSQAMMMSGLVPALLGVSVDFLSAGCTTATQDFFWSATSREGEGAAASTRDASHPLAGFSAHRATPNPSTAAGVAGAVWLSMCSNFSVGMLHEALQIGHIDVVRLKRTAGWLELHTSPVARTRVVSLSGMCAVLPPVEQARLQVTLRETARRAVSSLYGQLMRRLQTDRSEREVCLVASRDARRCLLIASFTSLVSRDRLSLDFVLQPVQARANPTTTATRANAKDGSATDAVDQGDGTPQRSAEVPKAVSVAPLESLFLIPYVVVMLEFIAECGHIQQQVTARSPDLTVVAGDRHCSIAEVRRCLEEVSSRLAADLKESRHYCFEAQRDIRDRIAEDAASTDGRTVKGKRFKPYKGRSFMDIFRAARAPMSERVLHFSYESASPELLRRIFYEWRYLLNVVALHFAVDRYLDLSAPHDMVRATPSESVQESSGELPRAALDTIAAVSLLPFLPSELEQLAAEPFLRSCWDELSVHTAFPSESTVGMVVKSIDRRLRDLTSPPSVSLLPPVTPPPTAVVPATHGAHASRLAQTTVVTMTQETTDAPRALTPYGSTTSDAACAPAVSEVPANSCEAQDLADDAPRLACSSTPPSSSDSGEKVQSLPHDANTGAAPHDETDTSTSLPATRTYYGDDQGSTF